MEKISIDEISTILTEKIKNFSDPSQMQEVGSVVMVGDGIARAYGLSQVMAGEMVEFESGARGVVLNLEENNVGIAILDNFTSVKEGDKVKRTKEINAVPVGEQLLGRVVNPLGVAIDGQGELSRDTMGTVEVKAPGIIARKSVDQPLHTGLKVVDSMTPIGRGQRELIIGDRKTGKTAVCLDTIINQKGEDVICIYVAIGQKASTVAKVVEKLRKEGAMDYTIVVCASAKDSAPLQFFAPYAGCAMAEYFLNKGKHVVIFYDDLTKQANAYRELSLLLRRPPGREAFPGDVFYLHSRLLERACKLSDANGGGSITAFPIVETQAGDISAYIPTNVISITDGQIFLETDLFFSGVRPAMNAGLSVSRVGSAAQIPCMAKVAGTLRLELAQYRELEAFSQFGSDLDEATKKTLKRGSILVEILKQPQYKPLDAALVVASIFAATNSFLDNVELEKIKDWEGALHAFLMDKKSELIARINGGAKLKDVEGELKDAIKDFSDGFGGV